MVKFYKTIIQGDTYRTRIIIKDKEKRKLTPEDIYKVYVTCNKLEIRKDIVFNEDDENYIFSLESTETEKFNCGTYTFDITVIFNSEDVKTVTYQSEFLIKPKTNKI